MRIIAGRLRGRTLKTPEEAGVRPISGRIKQSLFDIIAGLVPGSKFLDLFAGTGAVGIEALSRGAERAVFVDMNPRCVERLRQNLEAAGLSAKAQVHRGNVLADLSWIAFRAGVSPFDLIFLGPPYKDEEKRPLAYTSKALANVAASGLLAPKGIVISQHQVKEPVAPVAGLEMFRREKYGDSFLSFYRLAPR